MIGIDEFILGILSIMLSIRLGWLYWRGRAKLLLFLTIVIFILGVKFIRKSFMGEITGSGAIIGIGVLLLIESARLFQIWYEKHLKVYLGLAIISLLFTYESFKLGIKGQEIEIYLKNQYFSSFLIILAACLTCVIGILWWSGKFPKDTDRKINKKTIQTLKNLEK
jgi:hypothetical protein